MSLVPLDREWTVAVNTVDVLAHYPVAEPAEHWDNGKLLLERGLIELFDHLLRFAVLVTLGVEHQTLVDHIQAV